MNELEKLIAEKLGISSELAHKGILITADYLKTKLPPPIFKDLELILKMPEIKEEEALELGLFRFP